MKGLTPIVGTVLLLFIGVGLFGTASFYVEDIYTQVQDGLEEETSELEREDATQITVINSSDCTIRNTGGVFINGSTWFIDGKNISGPSELKPGETHTFGSCSGVLEHPQGASATVN
jgi:hypothetical protein